MAADAPTAVVKWLGSLPEWEAAAVAFGTFASIMIGVVWKIVAAFKRGRREAMADQEKAFERDQAARASSRDADVTGSFEAAAALGAKLGRVEWSLETCRERCRELEAANRSIGDDSALKSQALIDVRYKLELAEKKVEVLTKERDALAARLEVVERAKTDPPPRSAE